MRTPETPFWHHSEKTAQQPVGPVMHELLEPDDDRPQWQVHADNSFTINIPLYLENPGEDGKPVDAPITFRPSDLKTRNRRESIDSTNSQDIVASRVFSILVGTDSEGYSNSVFDYANLQSLFANPSELSTLVEDSNSDSLLNEKKFTRSSNSRNLNINASPGSEHMQALSQLAQLVGDGNFQNPHTIVSSVYQEKQETWETQDTVLNNPKKKKTNASPYNTAIEILNRRREEDQKVKESGQETLQTSEDFIRASVPVIDKAAVFYSHDSENIPPEIIADLRKVKENIGADRYKVPPQPAEPIPTEEDIISGKKPLNQEDAMKIVNKKDTDVFRAELQKLRQEHQLDPNNPNVQQAYIHALNKVHSGVFSPEQIKIFLQELPDLAETPLENLSHEQVAMILSSEMEISSRGQQIKAPADEVIVNLAHQLNERGLFYINRPIGVGHDKTILHGTFLIGPDGLAFDLCGTCTPLQSIQFQSMLSTSLPLPTPAVPTFSPSFGIPNLLESLPAVGSGIPLLAQAFAFAGAGIGTVFSGGERRAGVKSSKVSTKPKTPETSPKTSKPRVIFQSSGGGNRSERKTTPPIQPKSKEHTAKTQLPKKSEKPKAAFVPPVFRPKTREVPIFTSQHESVPKVSRPITKEKRVVPPAVSKLKVERVPRIVLQPKILGRSGSERKVANMPHGESVTSGFTQTQTRRKEAPFARTSASFSKRLEQVFQAKTSQRAAVKQAESKASFSWSESSHTASQKTEHRTQHKNVGVVQTQSRVESQTEKVAKAMTAPTEVSKPTTAYSKTEQKTTKATFQRVVPPITTHHEKIHEATTVKAASKKNTGPVTQEEIRATHIQAKQVTPEKKQRVQVQEALEKQTRKDVEETSVATSAEAPQNTSENIVGGVATLVGGAVIEAAKLINYPRAETSITTEQKSTETNSPQSPEVDVVDALRARKHAEYGQGRGGGGSSQKKKTTTKVSIQQTDKVLTASMRSLPTNAMIDVSDSFNTAREVKMWAQEALAHPKLIERYYATAA